MDPRLSKLKSVTSAALGAAASQCPELDLHKNGLTLFLGRHYAKNPGGILMLGLNPGLLRETAGGAFLAAYPHSYDLLDSNALVGDPTDPEAQRVRYWRNARRCFGATPRLAYAMELATFSFCCPFRTPRWSALSSRQKRVLETQSRPILELVLTDCESSLVIVAGVESREIVFRSTVITQAGPPVSPSDAKWKAFEARAPWGATQVLQLPHFSYFNGLGDLQACGEWVSQFLGANNDSGGDDDRNDPHRH